MIKQILGARPLGQRSCFLDYLRATIIILVLFLHAILSYVPWARFDLMDYTHSTAPIVDTNTSIVFSQLPLLLNGFFMALMFFISGLFVWKSLLSKGSTLFLIDRLRRLGIPFLVMVGVIMPIAYYPSFLQTEAKTSFISYWTGWSWLSGPAWYLSLLFVFDLLAAICFQFVVHSKRQKLQLFFRQPSTFFAVLVLLSGASFMPMFAMFGPYQWFELAPFTIGQSCRIGLYLVYFFGGVSLGSVGLESTFLRHSGALSSRWWAWLLVSLIASYALVISSVGVKVDPVGPWTRPDGWALLGICIVIYSAILSIASLALFSRFVNIRHPWADSLSNNSYAIYIVHYPLVIWTQYVLLSWTMAAEIKAVVVFSISLALSWGLSVLLRQIPGIRAFI